MSAAFCLTTRHLSTLNFIFFKLNWSEPATT
jgi:hypothetical protein